jgi:hypothetical protein
MFGFLKRKKPALRSVTPGLADGGELLQSEPPLSVSVHRELVQGVLNDVMRNNGLAHDTFTFVVFQAERGPGARELHIQLTATDSGEKLQQQAHLLQRQIQTGVNRYAQLYRTDLDAFIVSWRFPLIYKTPAPAIQAPRTLRKSAGEARSNMADRRGSLDRRRKHRALSGATRPPAPFLPFDKGDDYAPTEFTPLR